MIITLASTEPWNVCRDARIWARLLDLSEDQTGRAAVSKVIRRLRDLNLIDSKRRGRKADLTLLLEDGTGGPYTYPEPKDDEYYLKLPHTFWDNGWYQKLDTPGLAMLLVLLAEKDGARLPIDQIPKWYGISRATAQRGFKELADHELITTWDQQRKAPLTPEGYTYDRYYRLTGDFKRTTKTAPPTTAKPPKAAARPSAKELLELAQGPKTTKPTGSKRRRDRRKTATTKRREAPT
jgi:DNA-binding transcriptional ArsR family regulator